MPPPRAIPGTAAITAASAGLFPLLAVIVPKSIVVILVVVGLFGLVLGIRERAWREMFPPAFTAIIVAFAGWSLHKSISTEGNWNSVELWLRLMALVVCGFGALWLFRSLSPAHRRGVHDALIVGMVVGLLILWISFVVYSITEFTVFGRGAPDPMTALSRGEAIIAMLSALAWAILFQRRHYVAAATLGVVTFAGFLVLPSNYAILALFHAALAFVIGLSLRRLGVGALMVLLVITGLFTPYLATEFLRYRGDDPGVTEKIRMFDLTGRMENSVRHRLQIWSFVTKRARDRQILDFGWGLDSSRRIPGAKKLTSLNAERLPLHPHNAFMQVWLELGLPGVVLLSLVMVYALAAGLLGQGPPLAYAVRAGAMLATFTVAMLAFGIWQNWWFSALFLTAALVVTFPAAAPREGVGRPIRLLINGLHARSGGGANYLRNMVPLLALDPDLEVHLCLREDQLAQWSGEDHRVRLHALPIGSGLWRQVWREQWLVPALAGRIGADVTFSPANYGPIFAPAPVIVLRNALGVAAFERRPRMMIYWALMYCATAASLATARSVIAVSDYARRTLAAGPLKLCARRITVIPHGVSTQFNPPADDGRRDGFVLAVSDIYIQKNFANLLRAFAILRVDHPDATLRIAGRPVDSEHFDELRRIVESEALERSVEFLGELHTEELAELYRRCAVFVFPSRVETFGNPLVEAMASGAPIVSSRSSAMPEILGDAAVYFDPGNVAEIAAAMDRLLKDPTLRGQLSAKALARARDFSWRRTAERTGTLIKLAATG